MINWHVSNEISLSKHRYTLLQAGDLQVSRLIYNGPKRTNWESYREYLKARLGFVPRVMHTVRDIELVFCDRPSSGPITKTVLPGWLSRQGRFLAGKKEVSLKSFKKAAF